MTTIALLIISLVVILYCAYQLFQEVIIRAENQQRPTKTEKAVVAERFIGAWNNITNSIQLKDKGELEHIPYTSLIQMKNKMTELRIRRESRQANNETVLDLKRDIGTIIAIHMFLLEELDYHDLQVDTNDEWCNREWPLK